MTHPWGEVALGAVCSVLPGFAFKSGDWSDSGTIVIRIGDIRADRTVDVGGATKVGIKLPLTPQLNRFVLRDGDIVLAMTGATAGKVGKLRVSELALLNQRVAKLSPTHVDPKYFWALISSAEYETLLFRLADGAAQPNMSASQIERLMLPNPPATVQRIIGEVLSAYDDLIEVNRRRVAILEEMARLVFEEWFVHLRFPGHETVPVHETPDGPLPEGWIYERMDRVADIKSGETKLTKASYTDQGYTAFSASGPDGLVKDYASSGEAVVVSAVGAYCGKTWLASGKWTCIANTFYLKPKRRVCANYLYFSTHGIQRWPRRGAAQPFIARGDAAKMVILAPPQEVSDRFSEIASPLMGAVRVLKEAYSRLAVARDLLLPRLVSGELSVAGWSQDRLLEAAD